MKLNWMFFKKKLFASILLYSILNTNSFVIADEQKDIDVDLVGKQNITTSTAPSTDNNISAVNIENKSQPQINDNKTAEEYENNKTNQPEIDVKQNIVVSKKNNSNSNNIEENIKQKYNDEFYSNFSVNDKKKEKKMQKPLKFELKVTDANDTKSGMAVKNLQEAFKFYKQKDYELALLYYKKSLAENPQSVEAQFGIGVSYQMLQQYDQAISTYLKLFNKNYSRKKLVNNLLLCLKHKSYKEALEILLSIDEKILGYADILGEIGIIYMKLNDNPKAISAFSKAHEISPTNAVIAYNLGVLYDRENNIDYAILNEKMAKINEQIMDEISKNKKK